MLQNAYLLVKIGADTAENDRNFAKIGRRSLSAASVTAALVRVGPRGRRAEPCGPSVEELPLEVPKLAGHDRFFAAKMPVPRRKCIFFKNVRERTSQDVCERVRTHNAGCVDVILP